jgi:phenylpropionate dioxygenase-like ring-hydroxylating dioxygenase large terminal subunit
VSEENAGLPAVWYTRPEAFARERRALFAGAWQLLGRRDQLNKPGDYLAATLGGWSVFAMLGDDGTLGAFQNVCRHQGLPVLDAGGGNCETLRCRYHGWTYGREGRFLKAPPAVAPTDPGDPLHRLVPIGVDVSAGLIFVRIESNEVALDAAVTSRLNGLICVGEAAVDIDANWKLVIENRLSDTDGAVHWSWPTLVVNSVPEGALVYQTMPRAFRRTRLVAHCYASGTSEAVPEMLEAAKPAAGEIKRWCEEQQRTLEGSSATRETESPRACFHARLREAHNASEKSPSAGS